MLQTTMRASLRMGLGVGSAALDTIVGRDLGAPEE